MFYKVVFFPSKEKEKLYLKLKNILSSLGAWESSDDNAEYIFIIGGDGTFLHFAKEYAFKDKKLVGIQAGHTAFLASLKLDDLNDLDNLSWRYMDLFKVDIEDKIYYAINDLYIAGDLFLETNIYIEDCLLEKFRGTGLLFSTRNGSTGKNKSIGGPILLTDKDLWIVQELGSCNTNKSSSLNSSIVLSSSNKAKIEISKEKNYRIYIDGRYLNTKSSIVNISLIKSTSKVVDVGFMSYIDKLRSTFIMDNG